MPLNTTTKGKSFEREIRRILLKDGYFARRTPRSGATDFAKGDIQFLPHKHHRSIRANHQPHSWSGSYTIECKRKKKLPSWLTECLEHDVVALREDRGKTVVVMKFETWLELMK